MAAASRVAMSRYHLMIALAGLCVAAPCVMADLEIEPNDTAGQATALAYPEQISGVTDGTGYDWFRFTLNQSSRIRVEATASGSNGALQYIIHKLRPTNDTVIEHTLCSHLRGIV